MAEFFARKGVCKGGKREEMRVVWEALKPDGSFIVVDWDLGGCFLPSVLRGEGEASWTRLWQILDHSIEEWAARWTQMEEGTQMEWTQMEWTRMEEWTQMEWTRMEEWTQMEEKLPRWKQMDEQR